MKIGDYVRTRNGLIAKYIGHNKEFKWHIFDGNVQWFYEYYRADIDDCDWEEFKEEEILKTSPNLIDLIEAGDYVNGYKVDFVQNGEVIYNHNHPYKLNLMAKDIKSIVTKEQFKEMEYKMND